MRRVSVAEAIALSEIVGHSVETLASGGQAIDKDTLQREYTNLNEARERLDAAIFSYTDAMLEVVRAADSADITTTRDEQWLGDTGLPEQTPHRLAKDSLHYLSAKVQREQVPQSHYVQLLLNLLEQDNNLLIKRSSLHHG